MNVIEVHALEKIYSDSEVKVFALNGVDLTIEEGEFTAIVGPSGSGKTTFLNMIGGLDQPTSGQISIGGTDISKLSSSQMIDFRLRNIGFVFQAYNLIPVLTAKENVEFIMPLQNRPKKERETRTMDLLKAVGLEGRENSRPNKLSGGQQQRVAVARALANRPSLILADEPTAALDSVRGRQVMELFRKVAHEQQTGVIVVTHDHRALEVFDRMLAMEDGLVSTAAE